MEKAPSSVGCSIVCLSTVKKFEHQTASMTELQRPNRLQDDVPTCVLCQCMLVQFVGW